MSAPANHSAQPIVTILDAVRDHDLFARWFRDTVSFACWCILLSALFGLPLDPAQLEIFRKCTGRAAPSASGYIEAWLIVGRRGGKSLILALIAVYLAVFKVWSDRLVPGERGTVLVIAADRRQARVIFRYITALITETPMIAAMVVGEHTGSN
jgi:phage terminase large subunit-like protein